MSLSTYALRPQVGKSSAFLVLLLLSLFPVSASALEVSGLYVAEAPVAGTEAEHRNAAIRLAFEQVLVKVTGNRRIVTRKELAADLRNAARFVQQYSYRQVEEPAGEMTDSEPPRQLLVTFDKAAIDASLRQHGLPVWNENRPGILVWMGLERNGRRRLMDLERDASLRDGLEQTAGGRGLPLIFPLMDLQDQGSLQVADLWGDFAANIQNASSRYSPDIILTGRLARVRQGVWRGSWRLYQGEQQTRWDSEGANQRLAASEGMQHAADLLAERFAPLLPATGLSTVRLRVGGIQDLDTYLRVGRLLRTQSSLEQTVVVTVDTDSVIYDLHGRGGVPALEQGLGLGSVIEPDPDAPFTSLDQSIDLYFRVR